MNKPTTMEYLFPGRPSPDGYDSVWSFRQRGKSGIRRFTATNWL